MNETVFGIGFVVTIAASFVFAVFVGAKDPLEIEPRYLHQLPPPYPVFDAPPEHPRPRVIAIHHTDRAETVVERLSPGEQALLDAMFGRDNRMTRREYRRRKSA